MSILSVISLTYTLLEIDRLNYLKMLFPTVSDPVPDTIIYADLAGFEPVKQVLVPHNIVDLLQPRMACRERSPAGKEEFLRLYGTVQWDLASLPGAQYII